MWAIFSNFTGGSHEKIHYRAVAVLAIAGSTAV